MLNLKAAIKSRTERSSSDRVSSSGPHLPPFGETTFPDPMILAVGRVADRIVPVEGQAAIRPMSTMTLSVDHRALDGVVGARFLTRVKDLLESPFELLR